MRPLAFTLPYFLVFAAVFIWSFIAESAVVRAARKAAAGGAAPDDRNSLQVVMLAQGLGFFTVFFLAWRPLWGRFHDQRVAFWIGIVIMIGAAALRRLCFRALGTSFTGEVRVRDDQRVVTSGPYRFVRHPSYTAGILLVGGLGIALGTWLGAALGTALSVAGYAYRVAVEERALATKLGDPYREYMMRTKRFIPFVI